MTQLGFSWSGYKSSYYLREKEKPTKNQENCYELVTLWVCRGCHLTTDVLVSEVHKNELEDYEITTDTL